MVSGARTVSRARCHQGGSDNPGMSVAPPFDPARVQQLAIESLQIEADAVAALAQRVDARFADAVRLLEWGREWPAIAGLIARMADRPPEQEIWKILRAHRTEILSRARRPVD